MTKRVRLNAVYPTMENQALRFDRENLRLFDTVAALANVEALGHGLWSDMKTLQMLADLGNQAKFGIRMRFGHPGWSDNAMGMKIGRAFNYRVVENKLLHDVRFFEPASRSPVYDQDVIEYVFDMAEQHPEEIAESVVIHTDAVWTLSDGREVDADDDSEWDDDIIRDGRGRPVNATTPYPVMRPVTFYYDDFVSEGALTHDGLFSASAADFFIGTSQHAAQIFEVMDDLRATYGLSMEEMRRKADALFIRYQTSRRGEIRMSEETNKKVTTSDAPVPEVESDHEDLSALLAESAEVAETVTAEPEAQYVTVEQYNVLVERFNALTEQFNQVVAVAKNQQKILTALTRQTAKVTGEKIVTQFVGNQPTQVAQLADLNPLAEIARGNIHVPPRPKSAQASKLNTGLSAPGLGSGLRLSGAGK